MSENAPREFNLTQWFENELADAAISTIEIDVVPGSSGPELRLRSEAIRRLTSAATEHLRHTMIDMELDRLFGDPEADWRR